MPPPPYALPPTGRRGGGGGPPSCASENHETILFTHSRSHLQRLRFGYNGKFLSSTLMFKTLLKWTTSSNQLISMNVIARYKRDPVSNTISVQNYWPLHTVPDWLPSQILMDTMILCRSVFTALRATTRLIPFNYCTDFIGVRLCISLGQCENILSCM